MTGVQRRFIPLQDQHWAALDQFPGTLVSPFFEPVPQGSIHKLRMTAGTVIPRHAHPCDEYVYVLEGIIETGDRECSAGAIWFVPKDIDNGPHRAVTDVELLTIRLGPMGIFESSSAKR